MKVWKKEFSPCEGELAALRRGEEWDPVRKFVISIWPNMWGSIFGELCIGLKTGLKGIENIRLFEGQQ